MMAMVREAVQGISRNNRVSYPRAMINDVCVLRATTAVVVSRDKTRRRLDSLVLQY